MKRSPILRKTPLKRGGWLRKASPKRAKQLREYSTARKVFLAAHPICQVWLAENGWEELGSYQYGSMRYGITLGMLLHYNFAAPFSTEVHHKNKRRGAMLLDQAFWMAVSREAHERIESNKAWAREKGYLLNF